ncbi:MAG: hypothetical protein GW946_00780 [Candidatus Pacebacteria bacterium]|nr:hypothetical protein [Candidatus Paceibacterota bacterium]PIR60852.1 MAG: hypothetical protein COU67_00135 [Candidatus Pacebacteria bacterium CG10_big_fil_rev_8_21_14_0_10_44_54]
MSNIQPETSSTGAKHEEFVARRKAIEEFFLINPPAVDVSTTPGGGEIHIYHQIWCRPEIVFAQLDGPLQVTVYIPGLQMIAKPNAGNVPEIHMASQLAEAGTNAVMMIKPEGQNAAAYTGDRARPLSEVSLAAARRIMKEISNLLATGQTASVRIVGTSEGSSLAPSIIKHLLDEQSQRFSMTAFLSVCGGGLVGAKSMELTAVAAYLLENIRANKAVVVPPHTGLVRTLPDGSAFIDGRVFGSTSISGMDAALGERMQDLGQDAANFRSMIMRMVATQLGLSGRLPFERLAAIFQPNPDWKQVAEAGIPTTIIASQRDPFFSAPRVRAALHQLQSEQPDWRPTTITTDLEHADFHAYAQGVAAIAHAATYSAAHTR